MPALWHIKTGSLQANFLRDLNRRGDHEAVVRAFESGQLASSEAMLSEYVKALVAVDRLDTSSLIRTLQVCAQNRYRSSVGGDYGCELCRSGAL